MAHKVMIGGTAYEVKGGSVMVDGTAYKIKKGLTMVDGTVYEIPFDSFNENRWTLNEELNLVSGMDVGDTLIAEVTFTVPNLSKDNLGYGWTFNYLNLYANYGAYGATPLLMFGEYVEVYNANNYNRWGLGEQYRTILVEPDTMSSDARYWLRDNAVQG